MIAMYTCGQSTTKVMHWCIKHKLDGVVTDHIPKFLEISENSAEENSYRWSLKPLYELLRYNFWVFIFGIVFRQRYRTCFKTQPIKEKTK